MTRKLIIEGNAVYEIDEDTKGKRIPGMSTGRNVTREVRKDMADRDKRI